MDSAILTAFHDHLYIACATFGAMAIVWKVGRLIGNGLVAWMEMWVTKEGE